MFRTYRRPSAFRLDHLEPTINGRILFCDRGTYNDENLVPLSMFGKYHSSLGQTCSYLASACTSFVIICYLLAGHFVAGWASLRYLRFSHSFTTVSYHCSHATTVARRGRVGASDGGDTQSHGFCLARAGTGRPSAGPYERTIPWSCVVGICLAYVSKTVTPTVPRRGLCADKARTKFGTIAEMTYAAIPASFGSRRGNLPVMPAAIRER